MNTKVILFGMPPVDHIALTTDELEAMNSLGYKCHTIFYGRNNQRENLLKKIIPTVANAFKILSKIKETKPDFLYLNSRFEKVGSARDFITLFILKLFYYKPLKVVVKSHGSDVAILENSPFFYKKIILPFLIKNVDAWIFLSNEELEVIRNSKPQMVEDVYILPNPIVPERCVTSNGFAEKYSLPKDKLICLFAGRLRREKGIFDIVKSVQYLKHPEKFHFIIVGSGEDMKELKKATQEYSSVLKIHFTGHLPDAECDQFYGVSDILIYPTFASEGFPMALFKSVACGMAIITTQIRAAKDHLKEPENVLWVKAKSPKEIAIALEKVSTEKQLKENMQINNINIGKKFAPGAVGRQLDKILIKIST